MGKNAILVKKVCFFSGRLVLRKKLKNEFTTVLVAKKLIIIEKKKKKTDNCYTFHSILGLF